MTSRKINTKAYLFVHLCIGHRNTASRFNLDYASVASFDLVVFRLCRCDSALFYSFLFSLCYVISVYLLLHYDDICSVILEYVIEDYFVRTIHSNMIWYDKCYYLWYRYVCYCTMECYDMMWHRYLIRVLSLLSEWSYSSSFCRCKRSIWYGEGFTWSRSRSWNKW